MIRHIVMWQLHDPADAPKFKALLDSCKALVPGMVEFEVGTRTPGLEANMDVVLVSTFTDKAALDAYQNHPHHKAVGAELAKMRSARSVLDYVTEAPSLADVDLGDDLSYAPTAPAPL
ncbi:Dabb family protein [Caldimonas thermodepolymerans]|jgi:quinol monooxygenase YgiN|uniref:Stress responsive alpha/beta barrel protein n=1 Tax=Caldimonas thermodepolymerans TaxID=215580 RepID=A0A2S5T6Q0_9BURK|nr:Dabb family protein [Caldimonas thermodepolymerans]PPE70619.1 stress responsive protein [Caldimonas thermodepolymerans]QPC30000.1 Dabb family protein [Caldimonas thermodepolymerans]RDH97622.1 stress responsive alpha/beta barrel protein [Caldimonas thermodepolymerans]TCP10035.1 stress responsive alpha/beta barrel protein [Caldimonas thermodepolymerans]UZG42745.1 Dabb family protein [Caldimonas thermodepolymerans]